MKRLLIASLLCAGAAGAAQGQQLTVTATAGLAIRDEKGQPCRGCTLGYSSADGLILGYKQADSLGVVTLPAELRGQIRQVSLKLPSGPYAAPVPTSGLVPGQVLALTRQTEAGILTAPKLLGEVVVTGHQQLIDDTGEAVVYNAAADLANAGTDATDVLRRTPLVSVDVNGAPSIKGRSSVKILLNGRAVSYLQPSDLLSQIPSDLITKVEVITSPGAKYDADGAAGILNIITKSPVALNHSGSVNAGAGSKGSHLFASDTYTSKNWSISNGVGLLSFYNKTQARQAVQGLTDDAPSFERTSDGRTSGLSTSYQGTISTLNKKNYVELSVTAFSQAVKPHEAFASYGGPGTAPLSTGTFASQAQNTTLGASLKFDRRFARNDQVISAAADYGYLPTHNTIDWQQASSLGLAEQQVRNHNYLHARSAKIDYEFNLRKKHFFEAGIKAGNSLATGTSTTRLDSHGGPEEGSTATEQVAYRTEATLAGSYLSYKLALTRRLTTKAGLRYEYTNNVYEVEKEAASLYTYRKSNLFPSLGLIYKVNTTSTLTLNYSYRLQRPQFGFTMPIASYVTSGMKTVGNPYLNPEFTHNVEIGTSKYFEANYFRLSAYRSTTLGAINSYSRTEGSTLTTTYRNSGTERITGINFWATAYPLKAWSVNYGFDANYRTITNGVLANSGFRMANTLNTTYRITPRWSAQLWGTFNTPMILLQGTENSYTFSNVSVRHEVVAKKLFVSVSVDNPFSRRFTQRQRFLTPEYRSTNDVQYYNRGIRLLLNYKFGNAKAAPAKAKGDLKSGFEAMSPDAN